MTVNSFDTVSKPERILFNLARHGMLGVGVLATAAAAVFYNNHANAHSRDMNASEQGVGHYLELVRDQDDDIQGSWWNGALTAAKNAIRSTGVVGGVDSGDLVAVRVEGDHSAGSIELAGELVDEAGASSEVKLDDTIWDLGRVIASQVDGGTVKDGTVIVVPRGDIDPRNPRILDTSCAQSGEGLAAVYTCELVG